MPRFARLGLPLAARLKAPGTLALAAAFSLLATILLIVLAETLTGFGGRGLDNVVHDELTCAVYVTVAILVIARAMRGGPHRGAWTLFAIGLSLYGVGNLLWTFWLEHVKDPPIPSVCDALWLSLYPFAYLGIMGIAKKPGEPRAPARLWFDALICGAGVAAIASALIVGSAISTTGGSVAVVTEIVYVIADLLLAALVMGVLALRSWRLNRTWGLLAAGFLVLAAADCLYTSELASGSTNAGTMTNLFYLAGVSLLALAAWQAEPEHPGRHDTRWAVLLLPAGFTLTSLGLLVYDHFHRLHPLAFGLAILTLLASTGRMALALRDVLHLTNARRLAVTDDLTSLPNRRLFMERAGDAIAAARLTGGKLAVMMLDLDNFKDLNETLGHAAGDALLRRIGPRLRRAVRQNDMIARLGGDEFAILVDPLYDSAGAARVAGKLLRALSEPFPIQGLRLRLTASIGIASFPDHASDAEELMRRADVAMYLAKTGRSGFAFYAPERDTNSRERLVLAGEFATALEEGGIEVHFQPKAETESRRIVGAEALVRWRRADGTLMLPGEFVQAAEQAGLSRPLTRAVLDQALDQVGRWREAGRDLHVAVNTTVADLLDADFPGEVARALHTRGLPPDALVLEVTESSVLADPARIGNVLTRLGEIGVELSLDDFGTGYSSLAHLRALPVREVKVDRSFVAWMCSDETDAAIVYATIQLAHKLGMRVIAEGVEDEATWTALRELGCDLIQGYGLARPMPAHELEAMLEPAATAGGGG